MYRKVAWKVNYFFYSKLGGANKINMGYWLEDRIFGEQKEDRREHFKEIGEKVFSFFLDKAIERGFQDREGQWVMSCEIVDGIKDKKHVLIEAGVGIGKSFAYIVPMLYYNRIYKVPVVIATSTIALQEQLTHDIGTILDMLRIDVEVLIAKGQNHFLCKQRMDECFTKSFIDKDEKHKEIYCAISKFGYEKADWDINIPDVIWNQINVNQYNPKQCKDKCSYSSSCHYYNLRQSMLKTRGIIVCNQDLLAINMQKKIYDRKQLMSSDIGLVVIDEAHNLESRVRASVTSCITIQRIHNSINGASKAVDMFDAEIPKKIEQANLLINDAFISLQKQMDEQDKVAQLKGQDVDRYYVRQVDEEFEKLQLTLQDILEKASLDFGTYIGDRNYKNFDDEIEELEDCVSFLESVNQRDNSNDIFWLERSNGQKGIKGVRLYKCPKRVDRITQNIMFNDRELPVVLTSATITSGKHTGNEENYSYFIKNTGFPVDKGLICEAKDSPFLYDEHTMIYYTENMPHPSHDRQKFIENGVKEIVKLLKISNGKALILFTAKTDMREVYQKLIDEKLPFDIMMQKGNAKQAETLEKFRKNTNSVLLGTGSFWEGINIEGVSLSHVIIFKLPFPVREPIIDYKYSQCKNGLMEVSVPEMIIKLKQGIGRLIRSENDKGIVSIIDSRVGEKSNAPYKNIIWESLPITNKTNDIEELRKFYKSVVQGDDENGVYKE